MRRGLPSFLDVTIIGLHHTTGSPIGTGSIIPSSISLSRLAFTCSFQCIGTGIGTCVANGTASSLRCICAGLQFIARNGVDRLNTLAENFSVMYAFSLGIFSSVAGNGSRSGRFGITDSVVTRPIVDRS